MDKKKKIIVECPKCKNEFSYYSSQARPFCSSHCKQVDLGGWLTGEYAIAGKDLPPSYDQENSEYEQDETLTH